MHILAYNDEIEFFCIKCMTSFAEEEKLCDRKDFPYAANTWVCDCPRCAHRCFSRHRHLAYKPVFKD